MTNGKARAPGALTIINAIATLKGSAFAIDLYTTAEVEITEDKTEITGEIEGDTDDTSLIEECVSKVFGEFGVEAGAHVRTESEIPASSGLKSSSAAANATVLATLDALSSMGVEGADSIDEKEAVMLGVEAARDAGVTITGALDDAAASMLGGVVVTDNENDEILKHEEVDWSAAVYIPDEKAPSADTDVERSRLVGPIIDVAVELALEGDYEEAMTINGLAYTAALGYDPSIIIDALRFVKGASLSGTGPSYGVIDNDTHTREVVKQWEDLPGKTIHARVENEGAKFL